MPSPIGHALGGLATGCVVAPRVRWYYLALFAIAGTLADIDFLLPIQHRGPSHGIGAAGLAFALALTMLPLGKARRVDLQLAGAVGVAYLSHLLFDWLGEDTSSPRGLMALWPFSQSFYVSGLDVFNAVNRRYWMPGFWRGNAVAVAREVAILGPLVWLVLRARRGDRGVEVHAVRRRRSDRIPGRSFGRDVRQRPSV